MPSKKGINNNNFFLLLCIKYLTIVHQKKRNEERKKEKEKKKCDAKIVQYIRSILQKVKRKKKNSILNPLLWFT